MKINSKPEVSVYSLHSEDNSAIFPDELTDEGLLACLQHSIDYSADEVLWIKPDSEIIYANRAAFKKLDCGRHELIGKHLWESDIQISKASWTTIWNELKDRKHIGFETKHQNDDGTSFPLSITGHHFEHKGVELFFAFITDLTMLKEQEIKLKNQNVALETMVKHKEVELEREKRKFESFVNLAPVGIAINRFEDGCFEYVNAEFGRFTGYSVDELNDMDYWQLTPQCYETQEQEQLDSLSKTGRYGPYQKEYIHRDGHCYPVLLSGIKIEDVDGKEYIWSVVQDITDEENKKQELIDAKEQIEAIAFRTNLANDSAHIGVWEWNVTDNTLLWDKWMYKLYDAKEDEFSGLYEAWESRVHPDDIDYARSELEDAVSGRGTYAPEFRVVHSDGSIKHLKAYAEVLRDGNGQALKVIGVNYDITERISAIQQLSAATKEAERASSSKSLFLANMSHEIRTPMNGIIGMTNQLLKTELKDKQLKGLKIVKSSANALLTIINDILDLSKIESGKLDIENTPFSLVEIVNDVSNTLSTMAKEKNLDLHVSFENWNYENTFYKGDPTRIRQVLLNLLSNAIKFTQQGKVTTRITRVQALNQCDSFRFEIIDTGRGIDKETQDKLFNPFTQEDESTTRKFGGTGLGLSICKQLVELMGGTIGFESERDKGSTFWFDLSFQKVIDSKEKAKSDEQQHWERVIFPGARVLLVEDNPVNREVALMNFADAKVDVDSAENGSIALQLVRDNDYDIVFMDCQMPVMDGYTATKEIRMLEKAKHLPIVALTANAMDGEMKKCLNAGMTDYLSKPFEYEDIAKVLNKFLAHCRAYAE